MLSEEQEAIKSLTHGLRAQGFTAEQAKNALIEARTPYRECVQQVIDDVYGTQDIGKLVNIHCVYEGDLINLEPLPDSGAVTIYILEEAMNSDEMEYIEFNENVVMYQSGTDNIVAVLFYGDWKLAWQEMVPPVVTKNLRLYSSSWEGDDKPVITSVSKLATVYMVHDVGVDNPLAQLPATSEDLTVYIWENCAWGEVLGYVETEHAALLFEIERPNDVVGVVHCGHTTWTSGKVHWSKFVPECVAKRFVERGVWEGETK